MTGRSVGDGMAAAASDLERIEGAMALPVSRRPGRGHSRRPRGSSPGPRGGYTLVEMLVALVVTGVLASGVIGLLLRQNAFYGQTDDLVFAEQSLRATADLVTSELRSASPDDIVEAGADRLTFEYDLVRAVVCEVSGGDVYYYVIEETDNANVGSRAGVAFRNPYTAAGYRYDRDYTKDRSIATDENDVIAETCAEGGGPSPTEANYRRFRRLPSWDAAVGPPADGAYLRFFGRLSYEFRPSSTGSGRALYRGSQELASSFEPDASFSYVMADGSVTGSTTSFSDIRRIRISATAVGDGANRYDVARDLTYDVHLRNRSD